MVDRRRAVITGLGVISPIGLEVGTFWDAAVSGKSGVSRITNWEPEGQTVLFGGEIKEADFDPAKYMDAKEAKRLDRFTQFALASAAEAVAGSGIDLDSLDPFRVGVIYGTGVGGIAEMQAQCDRMFRGGPSRVSPFLIPKMMANAAAGNIAIRYGARGPNFDVTTACASATHALGQALLAVRSGTADVVISGGSEAGLTPIGVAGFANMKALSTRNDDPAAASRPFDADRDGFIVGEGAGAVVIEELEHAKARGATIYAELSGYASTCDAYHITAPDPEGAVAAGTMKLALDDAERNVEDTSYINTHSPSTPYGDAMESAAIRNLFGSREKQPPVSGLKSMIGHLLGASGALSAVAAALSIRDQRVHPTINYTTADPRCDVDCVPNEARDLDVRVVLSNAFGFGGHNASVVLTQPN
jgi:3-oxoacyl-[acyl-carrier-protein] synthase II